LPKSYELITNDAMTIFDQEMVGQPDLKVASVCRAEERALITLDLDFSDIRTYPPAAHSGFIILRPRKMDLSAS
jgi:predicted nuclease of predicted toxin-antitoxin system